VEIWADGINPQDPQIPYAVRALVKAIQRVSGHVRNTEAERDRYLSKALAMGSPHLFITINPNDNSSPLLCTLAGKPIDLGLTSRDNPQLPGYFQRAQLVANNPVAAAKFFHHVVDGFLKYMLGWKQNLMKILNKDRYGFFGDIKWSPKIEEHCISTA
jgi:hypothetical protein